MHPGEMECLVRWASTLEATRREAEAQLTRPLSSPGLRCACALVQAARLVRVMGEGVQVTAWGVAQIHAAAREHELAQAVRLGRIVVTAARNVGRASRSFLRACGRAGWAGLSVCLSGRTLP